MTQRLAPPRRLYRCLANFLAVPVCDAQTTRAFSSFSSSGIPMRKSSPTAPKEIPSPSPYCVLVHMPSASWTRTLPRSDRRLSTTSSASCWTTSSCVRGLGRLFLDLPLLLLMLLVLLLVLPLRLPLFWLPLFWLPLFWLLLLLSVDLRPRSARPASSKAAAVRSSKSLASTHDPSASCASPINLRADRRDSSACSSRTVSSMALTTTPLSNSAGLLLSSERDESEDPTDALSSLSSSPALLLSATAFAATLLLFSFEGRENFILL
mmetsp:Transcript_37453/g.81600  ORF Transcript_37453/g.81600 Transcript_37453/m.81600 type:complete len:266 (+) Transcript_37453:669-1466(+)